MRGRLLIILSSSLLTFSCGNVRSYATSDESAKSEAVKADADAKFEDLKHSKFCADAAEAFWKRNNWKDGTDLLDQSSYTNHFNKSMNKCLVDVHELNLEIEKDKVYESDNVFDALENKGIAVKQRITRKADPATEPGRYVLIRDGHLVGEDDAPSFLSWFETLMTN